MLCPGSRQNARKKREVRTKAAEMPKSLDQLPDEMRNAAEAENGCGIRLGKGDLLAEVQKHPPPPGNKDSVFSCRIAMLNLHTGIQTLDIGKDGAVSDLRTRKYLMF